MLAADRMGTARAFLDRAGWPAGGMQPLAGDASFRRYFRLGDGRRRAVLMDAPAPYEDVRSFAAVARDLAAVGYSAPEILAEDREAGYLLIEDLGDTTYRAALAAGADEAELYEAATDLLTDLHRRPPPPWLAPYDTAVYLREADLLIDWFLPAFTGVPPDEELRAAYHAAWRAVLPHAGIGAPVLVLRDYHADNLMWLPERPGHRRVGLLDFQDALAGSPAYDLVSLLEDARRDVPVPLRETLIERYCAKTGTGRDAFRAAYAVLGAQRNAKIIGIFTRLARRDGKTGYLDFIPRIWRLLEGDLAHPALAPVRAWFDREVPRAWRRRPGP